MARHRYSPLAAYTPLTPLVRGAHPYPKRIQPKPIISNPNLIQPPRQRNRPHTRAATRTLPPRPRPNNFLSIHPLLPLFLLRQFLLPLLLHQRQLFPLHFSRARPSLLLFVVPLVRVHVHVLGTFLTKVRRPSAVRASDRIHTSPPFLCLRLIILVSKAHDTDTALWTGRGKSRAHAESNAKGDVVVVIVVWVWRVGSVCSTGLRLGDGLRGSDCGGAGRGHMFGRRDRGGRRDSRSSYVCRRCICALRNVACKYYNGTALTTIRA